MMHYTCATSNWALRGISTSSNARQPRRVIITADGDFARILALLRLRSPSLIFVREDGPHRAAELAEFLLAHFELMEEALAEGGLAVIHHERIRIRHFPIIPD